MSTPASSPAVLPASPPWRTVSDVAREYNKHSVTIKRWCATGFIFRLGFIIKRDPKGQWLLRREHPEQP